MPSCQLLASSHRLQSVCEKRSKRPTDLRGSYWCRRPVLRNHEVLMKISRLSFSSLPHDLVIPHLLVDWCQIPTVAAVVVLVLVMASSCTRVTVQLVLVTRDSRFLPHGARRAFARSVFHVLKTVFHVLNLTMSFSVGWSCSKTRY